MLRRTTTNPLTTTRSLIGAPWLQSFYMATSNLPTMAICEAKPRLWCLHSNQTRRGKTRERHRINQHHVSGTTSSPRFRIPPLQLIHVITSAVTPPTVLLLVTASVLQGAKLLKSSKIGRVGFMSPWSGNFVKCLIPCRELNSISCRELPAMATSVSNACFRLPPNCSKRTSTAVPSRTIRVGHGYHRSVSSCSPQCSVCLQQDHPTFPSVHHGFSSLLNQNQRSENGCRRSSRRTWRISGRRIATASSSSSAVDETALEEVTVKIKVGPVRGLSEKVYKFQKIFGPSSSIVVVTLPKPLGIVFEESPLRNAYGKNRIMVGELIAGGNADRASRVAQLFLGAPRKNAQSNIPLVNGGVLPGDILRATTTAGVLVDFFGIRRPQRVMDLYVADGRPWHLVMRALHASFVADGELTLVLERRNTNF